MGLSSNKRVSTNARAKAKAHRCRKHAKPSTSMSSATGGTNRDTAAAACKRCKMNAAGLGNTYHKGHHEKCPFKKKATKGLSSSSSVQPALTFHAVGNKANGSTAAQFSARSLLMGAPRKGVGASAFVTSSGTVIFNPYRPGLSTQPAPAGTSASTSASTSTSATSTSAASAADPATTATATTSPSSSPPSSRSSSSTSSSSPPSSTSSRLDVSASNLRLIVDKYVASNDVSKITCPPGALAVAKYLVSHIPQYKKRTTELIGGGEEGTINRCLRDDFLRTFPPGNCAFTIPSEDVTLCPSPHYRAVEGMTIYIGRWDIQSPETALLCPEDGCDGNIVRERTMKNDCLLPIHDVGGIPSWNIPVSYKCSKCGSFISSVDGRVLHQLPGDIANGYPVDPRYAGKGSKFHMTIGLTSRMAQDFETTSNGNCFSVDLHELASDEYHRRRLRYLQSLSRHKHRSPPPPFISFDQFVGCTLPSPTVLRDRYDAALSSTLTVSGMSENDRHDREIQSVGCKVGYAEDHTYEALKNWRLRSSGGACIWDVATETGEIACFVIAPSSKQEHYAHAAEALVRRPNFNPKGKWSDICPKGTAFFSMLHGPGFEQRLGMFHFIKRIIDTMDPLHPDYFRAIRDLEACVWEVDQSTEAAVKRSLRDGSMNGKKHADEEIDAIYYSSSWKERYSQYICRYPIADGETINDNLDLWRIRGICRSNKRIRTALRVGSLSSKEIDGIPSHLRNHPGTYDDTIKIEENRLAKELGMPLPNDEAILQKYPPNNGEQFGSAFYYSEIERKKKFAPIPDSVRCPCDRCGGNPVQLPHLQQHVPASLESPSPVAEQDKVSELLAASEAPAPVSSYMYSHPYPYLHLTMAPMEQQSYYQQQQQQQLWPPPLPACAHGYHGHYGHYGYPYGYPPYQPSMPKPRKVAKERPACCQTYKDEFLSVEGSRKRGAPRHCPDCTVGLEIREKRKIARYNSM